MEFYEDLLRVIETLAIKYFGAQHCCAPKKEFLQIANLLRFEIAQLVMLLTLEAY